MRATTVQSATHHTAPTPPPAFIRPSTFDFGLWTFDLPHSTFPIRPSPFDLRPSIPPKKKMTKRTQKTALALSKTRFARKNEPKSNPPRDQTNPRGDRTNPCHPGRDGRSLRIFRLLAARSLVGQSREDVDGDGQVNPVDSGLMQAAFGSTVEGVSLEAAE